MCFLSPFLSFGNATPIAESSTNAARKRRRDHEEGCRGTRSSLSFCLYTTDRIKTMFVLYLFLKNVIIDYMGQRHEVRFT